MIKVLSALLFLFCGHLALAVNIGDHVAKVIQISKSGKTIIIDRGEKNSFYKDDIAYLLGSQKINDRYVYYPSIKMKLVKEGQKKSIWLVIEQFKTEVALNEKYLFFTLSDFLKGRSPIKVSRKKILTSKENQKENIKDSLSLNDHKLSKKKNDFTTVPLDINIELDTHHDLKLVDVDREELVLNIKKGKPIYKSPSNTKYLHSKSIVKFDKMIYAFLKNSNSKKIVELETDQIYLSSSQKLERFEQRKDENIEKLSKLYLDKGESWSDDLSDEDLSRLLFRVGQLKERDRRSHISAQQFYGQFYLGLSTKTSTSLNPDAEVVDGSNFGLLISAELFALKNFQNLRRLTFEIEGGYTKSLIGLEDYNASLSELSVTGFLNWYPFKNPALLQSGLWFVSLGTKASFFNVFVSQLQENAKYQSVTFPSLRLGMKYNFSQSFAARIYYQVESVSMTYQSGSDSFESEKTYSNPSAVLAISKFY